MTGERLADRYALTERFAAAGPAVLWHADDEPAGREVVVELAPADLPSPTHALSHPGLAPIVADGVVSAGRYVVRDAAGAPLSSMIDGCDRAQLLDLVGQVGFAAAALHEAGRSHGSVSADTVLLTELGRGGREASRSALGAQPIGVAGPIGVVRLVGDGWQPGAAPRDDIDALAALLDRPALTADAGVRDLLDRIRRDRSIDAAEVARSALALAAAPAGHVTRPLEPRTSSVTAPAREAAADTGAETDPAQRRVRNRLIGVGAVVVVVGLVLLKVFGGGANTVAVPRVTGLAYSTAAGSLRHAGLRARERLVVEPGVAGRVAAQSVAAGHKLKAGATVTLSVVAEPAGATP